MRNVEGFVAPGFERVGEALGAELAADADHGASFAALRDGEVLVNIWGGWADKRREKRWSEHTVAPVFSTTKAISAMVLARLVGLGLVDYEAPVASLWPAFGAHGKDKVTIAQALAHQAGVPGFAEPIDPMLWLDPPALSAALAALEPLWPPGSASGYHPLSWGYIVMEIAQRAAGRSLDAILREDICGPHGIDFQIGLPESEDHRAAAIAKPKRFADFGTITAPRRAAFFSPWSLPPRGETEWRRLAIPSANGYGTALAIARLCSILAHGGKLDGAEIITPDAFAALTTRRFLGADLVLPFEMDWRSGLVGNNRRFYGPNVAALGHSGSGGSCGFGDAQRGLSFAYVMNAQSHHITGDPRAGALAAALYACLG